MNTNDLITRYATMGKKTLGALAKQAKEVMTGETYNKFMNWCEKRKAESDKAMSFGNEILGGMFE